MAGNALRRRFLCLFLTTIALVAPPVFASEDQLAVGTRAFERGDFEGAASIWARAAAAYEREGRRHEQVEAILRLAHAHGALGQHRQAVAELDRALKLAAPGADRTQTLSILSRLGAAHLALGLPEAAEIHLRHGLALADERRDDAAVATLQNELGNVLIAQRRPADAVTAYRDSARRAARAGRHLLAARALANAAAAQQGAGNAAEADATLATARDHLRREGPSHDVAFTLVNVGLTYSGLRAALPGEGDRLLREAAAALQDAAAMAERIGDRRTASYAWGHLGSLYEADGRYDEALRLTRRARLAAQQVNAPEALSRWEWQAGRLLRRQGDTGAAIAAYRRAVELLQAIRPELVRQADSGLSFREALGPLYFELVDLLLQRAAAPVAGEDAAARLAEAREVVELFKVAELRDYFRDDCVDTALAKATRLEVVSRSAVIVYPILLPDRTELLVSMPAGLKRYVVPVGADTLTQEVRHFRRKLEKRTTREYLPHAQQLYAWLIRPLEDDLATLSIDTLVFVPDGPLRTIPMAALHDGTRFLVAKYALGTTPGLKLTEPQPIDRARTNVLAVGVTESVQGFPPLPSVSAELQALGGIFPITTLVDERFRIASFEKKLKEEQFNIVHVASHGQFGGEPDKNFLLTFDGKLTMDRLDEFIGLFKFREDPLELLTLSACDTAEGDDRAALGLAGVAVKAGARSALATLWNINDPASAELVAEFYRQLKDASVSRSVALQRAQLKLLGNPRYDHPGFWAPFLLINNWL